MYRVWQKLCAEFIGTFFFVLLSVGAVCADAALRSATQPALGPVGIALARGLAFAILVSALYRVSGGHFNPAITLGAWVTRTIGSISAILYGIVQILAAILACWTLTALVPSQIWRSVSLGAPELGANISRTQGIFLELLLTFVLVFAFCATAPDARSDSAPSSRFDSFGAPAGFAAGLAIFAGYLAGAPFTGASMNPALALGSAVAAHHFTNHGVYWAGPLLGGVLGAWIYHTLFNRRP
ncbi:MAG TPA: aquaporin [Candidatus Acidoferrales bacterium]|nr:aquaporin [Candidatus Acidoferrales bacterium]